MPTTNLGVWDWNSVSFQWRTKSRSDPEWTPRFCHFWWPFAWFRGIRWLCHQCTTKLALGWIDASFRRTACQDCLLVCLFLFVFCVWLIANFYLPKDFPWGRAWVWADHELPMISFWQEGLLMRLSASNLAYMIECIQLPQNLELWSYLFLPDGTTR